MYMESSDSVYISRAATSLSMYLPTGCGMFPCYTCQGRRKRGGRGGLGRPTFEGEGGVAPDTSRTHACRWSEVFPASCRSTFDRCACFIQDCSHQYSWPGFNKTTFAFPGLVDERLRISSARSHHLNSYSGSSCCVLCCRVTPFR